LFFIKQGNKMVDVDGLLAFLMENPHLSDSAKNISKLNKEIK